MAYKLDLEKATDAVQKNNAKLVCIQLPDGMKKQAAEIKDHIEAHTSAKIVIYFGSCFGACDMPLEVEKLGVDMLIAWGHTSFPWVLD